MIIIITFLVFLFDILSKIVVINYLQLEESVKVINNFLYLTYVRNTGAAWSILSNNSYVVLGISLLIIVGIIITICILRRKEKNKNTIEVNINNNSKKNVDQISHVISHDKIEI